jgi:hypothetical protein
MTYFSRLEPAPQPGHDIMAGGAFGLVDQQKAISEKIGLASSCH